MGKAQDKATYSYEMMKKVGIITFHASHNYGSMLQAYALQKTVEALGYNCEIINFRTKRQKKMYRPLPLDPRLLSVLKTIRFPKLAFNDLRKHRLFEEFIHEYLKVTNAEYSNLQQLREANFDYDAYISGSDQIWNTYCYDYDPAYFLDFVKGSAKKIAYAPSMGPRPETDVKTNNDSSIKKYLSFYNALSVREEGTADRIERITGIRPTVCLDPTLLLSREDWYSLTDNVSHIQGDYILLYTPLCDEKLYDKATEIAKKYHLKVVVTLFNHCFRYRNNRCIESYTPVGPKEFLTLIKYSRFVVCKSFHAVVFSLIFSRPFYAVNGMNDNRVNHLLKLTGLENFANYPEKNILDFGPDTFVKAFALLQPAKDKSINFLQDALS